MVNRLRWKRYFVLSSFSLLLGLWPIHALGLSKIVFVGIFLSAACSHLLLMLGVHEILTPSSGQSKFKKNAKIICCLSGKTLILAGAFYWGSQIMQDKVVIPLGFYLLQLIVLGFSLRRN